MTTSPNWITLSPLYERLLNVYPEVSPSLFMIDQNFVPWFELCDGECGAIILYQLYCFCILEHRLLALGGG